MYDETYGPAGTSQTLQQLEWALGRLRERGVAPGPDSRLNRMGEHLRGALEMPTRIATDPDFRLALTEAQRCATEFSAIANSIPPHPFVVDSALRKKLQLAYGGADTPDGDDDHSVVARNTQCELWLASWLAAGGKPVRSAEPDLELSYQFRWHGVAAKRVRSSKAIMKRTKEAADQVKKHAGVGFIALSLDQQLGQRAPSGEGAEAVGQRFFDIFPEVNAATAWLWERAPWVVGLICFGHLASWDMGTTPPRLEMDNLFHLVALSPKESDVEYFNSYFQEHNEAFARRFRQFTRVRGEDLTLGDRPGSGAQK